MENTDRIERGFQGVWIPKEIWLNNDLSWIEKLLLTEIASLAASEKGCFASDQYFADFLQVSKSSIGKALGNLKDKSLVKVLSFNGRVRKLGIVKFTEQDCNNGILQSCSVKFTEQDCKIYRHINTVINTEESIIDVNINGEKKFFEKEEKKTTEPQKEKRTFPLKNKKRQNTPPVLRATPQIKEEKEVPSWVQKNREQLIQDVESYKPAPKLKEYSLDEAKNAFMAYSNKHLIYSQIKSLNYAKFKDISNDLLEVVLDTYFAEKEAANALKFENTVHIYNSLKCYIENHAKSIKSMLFQFVPEQALGNGINAQKPNKQEQINEVHANVYHNEAAARSFENTIEEQRKINRFGRNY